MRSACFWFYLVVTLGGLVGRPAAAGEVNASADRLRTGWYGGEPMLYPGAAANNQFFRVLRDVSVPGAVLAQPLVLASGEVLIATERNWVYLLDASGNTMHAVRAEVGSWNEDAQGCHDLLEVGITGTPVVDEKGVAYFVTKSDVAGAAQFRLHALNTQTGVELGSPFPKIIGVSSARNQYARFNPALQTQRSALALVNGVVYIGFSSVCDLPAWQGWIFGVSTTTGEIVESWVTESAGQLGGGVWQSGSGMVSDFGPDGTPRLFFATGNGASFGATPRVETAPPANLSAAVARFTVNASGTITPTQFFSPYNAECLNSTDLDLGSGGVVGLPPPYFPPNLLVQAGKEGYVYLLDREHLGGFAQGTYPTAGSDKVLKRLGGYDALIQAPYGKSSASYCGTATGNGGVWSRAAVWPGDGGLLYIPTISPPGTSDEGSAGFLQVYQYGTDGLGVPTLSRAGHSKETFPFASGAPVVTSNGTLSGSAVVWLTVRNGNQPGALRAYATVPAGNVLPLLREWPLPYMAAKFAPPGVGNGRIYVGTDNDAFTGADIAYSNVIIGTGSGHVLVFGWDAAAAATAAIESALW